MQLEPYKLPLNFDPVQLNHELSKFNTTDWNSIPNESAIILTSVGGTLNWDFAISGPIKPTVFLERCPYVKQVLNALEIPISRCRFTKLTNKSIDYNYHWFRHTIIYVPIITNFTLFYNEQSMQMAVGEAWVVNPTIAIDTDNIFLAIEIPRTNQYNTLPSKTISYLAYSTPLNLATYQFEVLRPAEIEQLTTLSEAIPTDFAIKIKDFNKKWQTVFTKFGHNSAGELAYQDLISYFTKDIVAKVKILPNYAINVISSMLLTSPPQPKRFSRSLLTKKRLQVKPKVHWDVDYQSNLELEARHLQPNQLSILELCRSPSKLDKLQQVTKLGDDELIATVQRLLALKLLFENFQCPRFERPLFIVSAPRAGSTLLFNTLSVFSELWTIGEESHELIEAIPALHPAYHNFSSNRLTTTTPDISATLQQRFVRELQDRDGNSYLNFPVKQRPDKIRFMEKTPKNALRIPFLKAVFPEAIFIYLYRDPRENINSMMEFWRSRRFIAYQPLPGWPYSNWSFLLTPGWQKLANKPIAEIAAYQWQTANSYILDDLQALPKSAWCLINYADLIQQPKETIHKISEFAGLRWEQRIEQSLSNPLPISPMTLSAPSPDKWRKHEEEITRILPSLETILSRLEPLR